LAALNPETHRSHRIKWRQIVQASDGMEGDIGETGGEVKFEVRYQMEKLIFLANRGISSLCIFVSLMKVDLP
jgi:hypothetical protein